MLSKFGQIVIDEAHKITSTIRDMYGVKISEAEINALVYDTVIHVSNSKTKHICSDISIHCRQLFKTILNFNHKNNAATLAINNSAKVESGALIFSLKQLSMVLLDLELQYKISFRKNRNAIENLIQKLNILKCDDE